jgi:hypothetical protein
MGSYCPLKRDKRSIEALQVCRVLLLDMNMIYFEVIKSETSSGGEFLIPY